MKTSQRGIALVYIIGAIMALAAIVTGITVMTPSSTVTEINENKFGQAYYAAYSGLQYLKYAENGVYSDIGTFISTVNSGSPYTLATGDVFYVLLTAIDSSRYTVNYVIGASSYGANSVSQDNYTIASDLIRNFVAHQSVPKALGKYVTATNGLTNAQGTIIGDLLSGTYIFNSGVTIVGSVTSTSTTDTLNLQGTKIGGVGKYVCSDSNVIIGAVAITGNVYAHGDIDFTNGSVNGDLYATGDVTVSTGSTFSHNIYAGGNVYIKNAKITGNIYAGGNVAIGGSWPTITGDINSQKSVTITDGNVSGNVHDLAGLIVSQPYMFSGKESHDPTAPLPVIDCDQKISWEMTQYTATSDFYVGNGLKGSLSDNSDGSLRYYYYKNFIIGGASGGWGNFCLDISHNGEITTYVSGDLTNRGNYYVHNNALNNCYTQSVNSLDVPYYASASKFYMEVYGAVTFQGGSDWFGSIFSRGDITLGGGSIVIGGLYSIDGTINLSGSGGTSIRYVQADFLK